MRSSRFQIDFEKRNTRKDLPGFPMGLGGSSSGAFRGHLFAIHWMAPNGRIESSGTGLHIPVNEGKVSLLDLTVFELICQGLVGHVVFGHNQTSRCVLVKAMHNARPQFATNAFEVPAMVKQGVHQCSALVARCWMNDKARRLVYNDDMGILKKDGKGNRFGFAGNRPWWWHNRPDHVPFSGDITRLCRETIYRYMSRPDQLGGKGSGLGRKPGSEHRIESATCFSLGYRENDTWGFFSSRRGQANAIANERFLIL